MRASTFSSLILFLASQYVSGQPVSVTVTNQDLALVREERQISLQRGEVMFELTDLPALIDPTSVFIDPGDNKFRILEQNFEYDLLNAEKILLKAVGKKIRLVDPDGQAITGVLMQADNNDIIIQATNGELQILPRRQDYQINVEMSGDADGWITRPTLRWLIDAEQNGTAVAQVSYLTNGLTWQTEYIANLADDEKSMSLAAWVSVDNSSGKTYKNAYLRLIAGDIHLVEKMRSPRMARSAGMYEFMEKGFSEQEFFEYHLYTLERKTTLANNQTKQIELFPTVHTDINKTYQYNYQKHPTKIAVVLTTKNSKNTGLGIPLPKGTVRMYKESDKDQLFIGEDLIDHTAVDEKLELEIGNAFDISATRTVTMQAMVGKNSEQQTIVVDIRNHKQENIEVRVSEPIPPGRSYKILKSDFPVTSQDAQKIDFLVPVAKKAGKTIQFEILYSW